MKHNNSVFHQLLKQLPRQQFQKVVDRHNGDHRVRSLTCWTQLISLMFAQLTERKSLRDLEENFNYGDLVPYLNCIMNASYNQSSRFREHSTFCYLKMSSRKHWVCTLYSTTTWPCWNSWEPEQCCPWWRWTTQSRTCWPGCSWRGCAAEI